MFWFDYFQRRYPKQVVGYDYEYVDLGYILLGPRTTNTDVIVSVLWEYIKVGRRYNILTTRFGDSILLILPSTIGRTT